MEYYITSPKDYWIAPNAVNISLNALGRKNYIQASVASGAVIMCFIDSIKPATDPDGEPENGDGLWYGADHEPKRWPITISPTAFNSDTRKYVYVAIPRSSSVGTQAIVVFPSELLDIYGRAERLADDSSDDDDNAAVPGASASGDDSSDDSSEDTGPKKKYVQVGSTDFFYVYLQGIIGAADAVVLGERRWEDPITDREWGLLETAQGRDEQANSGEWYRWSVAEQTVHFLKRIVMNTGSWFANLIVGTGKTQGNLTGVATGGKDGNADVIPDDSKTHVVTPSYLDEFGNTRYLRKDIDDTANGKITFAQGIWLGLSKLYEITADGVARLNSIIVKNVMKSDNYTSDDILGTGWCLTNHYNGHSKLTIDELYVRMKAVFESLEVRERTYTGGDQIWSCAGNYVSRTDYMGNAVNPATGDELTADLYEDGTTFDGTKDIPHSRVALPGDMIGYSEVKVPWMLRGAAMILGKGNGFVSGLYSRYAKVRIVIPDETPSASRGANASSVVGDGIAVTPAINQIRRVRCYFLAKDDDREIHNWWRINDLARCQTMNLSNTNRQTYIGGRSTKAGNVFWWRKVIYISTDPVQLDDGKWYHYFDVAFNNVIEESDDQSSRATMATFALQGSDIPAATDSVVQFGNTINPGRMNLMMMEVNGGDGIDYPTHSDAPCLKAYRGIYCFDLNKCWVGGRTCKMKLSPSTGYEFYGPNFKQVTEYDVVPVPVERGLWTDICRKKNAAGAYINEWQFDADSFARVAPTPYSDDATTHRNYSSYVDGEGHVAAGAPVRKCYYYDKVSHKGCYWLCSIVDGEHWVCVTSFTHNGRTYQPGEYVPDDVWAAVTGEMQQYCKRESNYTIDEPSETSQDWTLMVARGTMGETPAMLFKEVVHGVTPSAPDSTIYTANRYMAANVEDSDDSSDDSSDEWIKTAPNRRSGYDVWMSQNTILTVDSNNYLLKNQLWSTPTRISGDQGDPGADADDQEWIYIGQSEYHDPYTSGGYTHPKDIASGLAPDPDYDPDDPEHSNPYITVTKDHQKEYDDYVPNGWSDTAIATNDSNHKFVYASWRDKQKGGDQWNDFNNPILWSNWGVQGIDGDGVQYIYKLFANKMTAQEETDNIPTTALLDDTTKEWMPKPSVSETLTSVTASTDIAVSILTSGRSIAAFTELTNQQGFIIEKYAEAADDSELEGTDWRVVTKADLPLTLDAAYTHVRVPVSIASFTVTAILATGDSTTPDSKNSGWSDNPLTPTVEMPYCYCSVIKKLDGDWRKNGEVGIFEKLGLWSRFSKDGQGAYKSTVFTRYNGTPATPSDQVQTIEGTTYNTYNNPIPPQVTGQPTWSDGIPSGDAQVWASSRIFTNDGQSPQQAAWSTPRPMTDTATYDVEFATKQTGDATPATPTANNRHKDTDPYGYEGQVWFDPDLDKYSASGVARDFTQMYWRAERECKNGAWGDWTIIRIKGEKGDQGDGQPEYIQTQEAWSNDETTTNVYTSPTTDYNAAAGQPGSAGYPDDDDWSATTPPNDNNYAYLWRRSCKMVLQANGTYLPEIDGQGHQWTYARLSGTNGTSIHTKGTVVVVIGASDSFSTTGFTANDLGIKQGDDQLYKFNGTTWDHNGPTATDGDSYTVTKYCMVDLEGDGSIINVQGHLIMWSDEANSGNGAWIDLGEFKGDPGTTYYTHIAWATSVNTTIPWSDTIPTGQISTPNYGQNAVTGGGVAPSDSKPWMGILINTDSGPDTAHWHYYTWQKVLGPQGPQGGRTATVYLYKRGASPIDTVGISSTLYYKFADKLLYTDSACTTVATTQLNGWSLDIPSGTDPIYVTAAVAYSETVADDIDSNEWVTPALFTGEHGINSATVFLYKRAASEPTGTAASPQQTLYYNFADGKLYATSALTTEATTELNGWSLAMPATDGDPCYVIQAVALSTEPYDAIEVVPAQSKNDWSSVRKMVEDGADGNGIVSITRTFAISNVGTTASETTEPTHQGSWTASSPAVTEQYPYLWAKEEVVFTDRTKNTTKYYCIGAKGDPGIDAQDFEWVYVRTTTETPPTIASDTETPQGYKNDDYLPLAKVSSGRIKGNGGTEADANTAVRCTDDPQGVNDTWKFEWELKRTKGAATNGRREWNNYTSGTAMTLHNNYAETAFVIDISNDNDQFGTDSNGVILPDQQVRSTDISLYFGSQAQELNADDAATPGVQAALTYEDGTSVPSTVATVSYGRDSSDHTKGNVVVTIGNPATQGTHVTFPSELSGLKVHITATCAMGSKSIDFPIQQVKSGAPGVSPTIYQLNPTNKDFVFNRDASNNLTPNSRSTVVNALKTVGNTTTDATSADSLTFTWGFDESSTAQESNKAIGSTISITNSQANAHYQVWVQLSTGDRETLPIIKDGASGQVNPNILLRTIFDKGIDFVKEKWTSDDWDHVFIDTASDTVTAGRKSIRLNALSAEHDVGLKQSVLGKIKPDTYYTVSFNAYHANGGNLIVSFYNMVDGNRTLLYDGDVIVDGTTVTPNSSDVVVPCGWNGARHYVTFKTRGSDYISSTDLKFMFWQVYDSSASGNHSISVICMPKLEEGGMATAYIANEDDLKGTDGTNGTNGTNGEDGWSCKAEPDNVFIEQDYNENDEIVFTPETVEFKVMKGSRNVTAFTLAAPTGKTLSDLSTEFYAARKGSSGDDAKKVQVTQPKTHTVGNVTQYYTKGSFTVIVNAVDPSDNTKTASFTVTVPCFAQMLGKRIKDAKGDVETDIATKLTYGIDPTSQEPYELQAIGTYISSASEKTDKIEETVTSLTTANPANIFGFTKGIKMSNSGNPVLPYIQGYGIEVCNVLVSSSVNAVRGNIMNIGMNGIEGTYVFSMEIMASQVVTKVVEGETVFRERFSIAPCNLWNAEHEKVIEGAAIVGSSLYYEPSTQWKRVAFTAQLTRETLGAGFDGAMSGSTNGRLDFISNVVDNNQNAVYLQQVETSSGQYEWKYNNGVTLSNPTRLYIRKLQIERASVPSIFGICKDDEEYAATNDHEYVDDKTNVALDDTSKWGTAPSTGDDRFKPTGAEWNGMAIYANGEPLTSSNGVADGDYRIMQLTRSNLKVTANTPYTLSFWAKANYSGAKMRAHLGCGNTGGQAYEQRSSMDYYQSARTNANGYTNIYIDTANQWRKYYVHFYAQRDKNTGDTGYAWADLRITTEDMTSAQRGSNDITFSVCGMKLEKGYITSYNRTDYATVFKQTSRSIDMSVLVNSVKKAGIELTTNQEGDVTEGVIMLTADRTEVSGDFYVPRVISETDTMITTIEAGQIIIRSKTTQSYGLFEINGNGEIILSMYDQNGNCVVNLGGTPNTLINGEWVNWKLCSKETGHTSDGKTYYAVSESQCTNYYQLKLGQVKNTNSTIEYYLPPVTGATEGTQTTDSDVIARNNKMFSNKITAGTVQVLVDAIKSATSFIANGYYVVPNNGRFEVEANQYGPTNYKVNLYHFVNGVLSEIITQRFSYT